MPDLDTTEVIKFMATTDERLKNLDNKLAERHEETLDRFRRMGERLGKVETEVSTLSSDLAVHRAGGNNNFDIKYKAGYGGAGFVIAGLLELLRHLISK